MESSEVGAGPPPGFSVAGRRHLLQGAEHLQSCWQGAFLVSFAECGSSQWLTFSGQNAERSRQRLRDLPEPEIC